MSLCLFSQGSGCIPFPTPFKQKEIPQAFLVIDSSRIAAYPDTHSARGTAATSLSTRDVSHSSRGAMGGIIMPPHLHGVKALS